MSSTPETRTGSTRSTASTRALWTVQILVGLFFVFASAAPKLLGDGTAVAIFTEIGAGQWFRYLVGVLELLGGIGLLIPRVAGAAALGLVLLLIGATYTQGVVLGGGALVLTPIVLGVLVGIVAWVRRREIGALIGR